MSPRALVCPVCRELEYQLAGELHVECRRHRRGARNRRRRGRPKWKHIYNSWRWRKPGGVRIRVLRRDRFACVECGFHDPSGRELIADHLHYRDPFNPATCVTRCRRCSGRKHGAQAAAGSSS